MKKKISELSEEEVMDLLEYGTQEQVDAIMRYLLATGQITFDQDVSGSDTNTNTDE